jgi:hypothetical protein
LSHLVVHWTGSAPAWVDGGSLADEIARRKQPVRTDLVTRPGLCTLPGATVARVTARERMTSTGFDLTPAWRRVVDTWHAGITSAPAGAHHEELAV